jgi:hypothetical protein
MKIELILLGLPCLSVFAMPTQPSLVPSTDSVLSTRCNSYLSGTGMCRRDGDETDEPAGMSDWSS